MLSAQTLIPGQIEHPSIISWLHAVQAHCSEPDYAAMEEMLANAEDVARFLGEVKVKTNEDRKLLRELAVAASEAAKRLEQGMESVNALPKSVPWRQNAYDKFEHLVCRIEDIAETSALASSREFAKLVETQMQSLANGKQRD